MYKIEDNRENVLSGLGLAEMEGSETKERIIVDTSAVSEAFKQKKRLI
ncbi:MAG: hypothetical protein LBS81_01550 [Endomicrobium sp.]|jgi:hypothetical protein|nr:hypothetical protein [Endomicrobium sp.]